MVITYLGGQCFKVTQGSLTIAFNPPSKDSSLKVSRFGSDIVLVSLQHPDFNGVEQASFGDREPFVIEGPGEYEVKDISVRGFSAPTSYDKNSTMNTIYSLLMEGMNLCFLGALSSPELPAAAKQELDKVDIVFLPIGGNGVLEYAEAYKLAVKLEPRMIIPMHYGTVGQKGALEHFLKEAGAEGIKAVDKLTLKKKDLEGKENDVVVLAV